MTKLALALAVLLAGCSGSPEATEQPVCVVGTLRCAGSVMQACCSGSDPAVCLGTGAAEWRSGKDCSSLTPPGRCVEVPVQMTEGPFSYPACVP